MFVAERNRNREKKVVKMVRTSEKREENITLAIDRDKESQNALKWAVSNLLSRGQTLTLLHVKLKQPSSLPYSGMTTKPIF